MYRDITGFYSTCVAYSFVTVILSMCLVLQRGTSSSLGNTSLALLLILMFFLTFEVFFIG